MIFLKRLRIAIILKKRWLGKDIQTYLRFFFLKIVFCKIQKSQYFVFRKIHFALDGLTIGYQNEIPLWLFGFLY